MPENPRQSAVDALEAQQPSSSPLVASILERLTNLEAEDRNLNDRVEALEGDVFGEDLGTTLEERVQSLELEVRAGATLATADKLADQMAGWLVEESLGPDDRVNEDNMRDALAKCLPRLLVELRRAQNAELGNAAALTAHPLTPKVANLDQLQREHSVRLDALGAALDTTSRQVTALEKGPTIVGTLRRVERLEQQVGALILDDNRASAPVGQLVGEVSDLVAGVTDRLAEVDAKVAEWEGAITAFVARAQEQWLTFFGRIEALEQAEADNSERLRELVHTAEEIVSICSAKDDEEVEEPGPAPAPAVPRGDIVLHIDEADEDIAAPPPGELTQSETDALARWATGRQPFTTNSTAKALVAKLLGVAVRP